MTSVPGPSGAVKRESRTPSASCQTRGPARQKGTVRAPATSLVTVCFCVQVAGLIDPLNVTVDAPAYTVFAPVDAAFMKLSADEGFDISAGIAGVPAAFLEALPLVRFHSLFTCHFVIQNSVRSLNQTLLIGVHSYTALIIRSQLTNNC